MNPQQRMDYAIKVAGLIIFALIFIALAMSAIKTVTQKTPTNATLDINTHDVTEASDTAATTLQVVENIPETEGTTLSQEEKDAIAKKRKELEDKVAMEKNKDKVSTSSLRAYAQTVVNKRLKAPSQAKYPWSDDSYDITHDGLKYQIKSTVSAPNSFGVMLDMDFDVTIEFDDYTYEYYTVIGLVIDGETIK